MCDQNYLFFQNEIYGVLRKLMMETDSNTFELMLSNFCNNDDLDTNEFQEYFNQYYVANRNSWTYCYRMHSGINTNMHLERMHGVLKHIYLKSKHVKRLDK